NPPREEVAVRSVPTSWASTCVARVATAPATASGVAGWGVGAVNRSPTRQWLRVSTKPALIADPPTSKPTVMSAHSALFACSVLMDLNATHQWYLWRHDRDLVA